METLLGIAGKGFVVLAADAQVGRSVLVYKRNIDRIATLDEMKLLAAGGPQSACVNFSEYIAKNIALYELNNDVKLSTKAAANFIRGELAKAIRKGPISANTLLGGMDKGADGKCEASLYWMDYLGTQQKVSYGAHGYGAAFTLSIMDREHMEGITEEEAVTIIDKCIHEIQTRFLVAQTNFVIKVVTADGIKVLRAPKPEVGETEAGAEAPTVPVQG